MCMTAIKVVILGTKVDGAIKLISASFEIISICIPIVTLLQKHRLRYVRNIPGIFLTALLIYPIFLIERKLSIIAALVT